MNSRLLTLATITTLTGLSPVAQDWYREDPTAPPPARRFHELGFDAARGVTVLFGGTDERTSTVFGDTWEFDGAEWRQRAQNGPPPRQRAASCVDTARGTFLVFGGIAADGRLLDDTWEWDGTRWLRIATPQVPQARADAEMVFDPLRGRVVLFGGRPDDPDQAFADTWVFDGRDWTLRPLDDVPEGRFGHVMTFDTARGVTLLFGGFVQGGSKTSSETFAYDGGTWTRVPTATTPPSMVFPAMTFHRAHGVAVLVGGSGSASQPLRTLVFDGTDWQAGPPAPAALTGRQGQALAYDEVREAVVLFGGASIAFGGARPFQDTWELSTQAAFTPFGHPCATSTGLLQLSAPGEPAPRIGRDFTLSAGPLPPLSPALLLLGADDRNWSGVPLPLDLEVIGMPGCGLFTSIDLAAAMIPLGQTAHAVLPIPLDRGLLGQELLAQVLAAGSENATSNAGRLRFGN